MSYLRHIRFCNTYRREAFRPFFVNDIRVGEVKHEFADTLANLCTSIRPDQRAVHWRPEANGFDQLNRAMSVLTESLLAAGHVPYRHGELYPVTESHRETPLFLMDRALVPYFGVRAFGQHLNGYLRRDGETYLWVARRSMKKRNFPGMLDNLVAGGLPWDLTLEQNLAKECYEEAGITADLAAQAQPVGTIAYRRETKHGLKPDTLYCYDLALPEDFTPRCTDGEVDEFHLWPLQRLADEIHSTDNIKPNCNLVMIDFLIRHGNITAAHPEYEALLAGLHGNPDGETATLY